MAGQYHGGEMVNGGRLQGSGQKMQVVNIVYIRSQQGEADDNRERQVIDNYSRLAEYKWLLRQKGDGH